MIEFLVLTFVILGYIVFYAALLVIAYVAFRVLKYEMEKKANTEPPILQAADCCFFV